MNTWLDIIGVPASGELSSAATALIGAATTVIGPQRLANGVCDGAVPWATGIEAMIAQVTANRGNPTAILASGDPNWFGIAATLARHLDAAEFAIYPSPSSLQLAAARLRWPLQNVAILSLHGRPVELLHPHLTPANRILALTSDRTTLAGVAAILKLRGYCESQVTVLENLGAAEERITSGTAADFNDYAVGDLYVLSIDCVAEATAPLLPSVPGLPDSAFINDGQLTKSDVRAATLGRLAPYPGALLWDVGAGCGSVAIEWLRAARDTRAVAFERQAMRLAMIETNAKALGVPHLALVAGDAPQNFAGQAAPDAIFIGGGVASEAIFAASWEALRRGGRLVANVVTLEGEVALFARQRQFGGDLVRIDIATLDTLGSSRALRPRLPVTQWTVTKP